MDIRATQSIDGLSWSGELEDAASEAERNQELSVALSVFREIDHPVDLVTRGKRV